jgi:perosamine synthetase
MIPVSRAVITSEDVKVVNDAISSGWVSSEGPYIELFEESIANAHQTSYGIAVSSGTAALECALYGLGISEGDEVIIPSFTIISCAIAVLRLGAIPVFVDVENDGWVIDMDQIERAITVRTKVVMVVHMYGSPVSLTRLKEMQVKHNFKILEDCAQSHGACVDGKPIGGQGDAATFSFYANKLITTGEGGMVVTSDPIVCDRARNYRNLCFDKERKFQHTGIGNNYRMTNLQAALGYSQTKRLEQIIEVKRYWGEKYLEVFLELDCQAKTQDEKPNQKHVYWMYSIELSLQSKLNAEEAINFFKQEGVGARHFYSPLHTQPALKKFGKRFCDSDYEISNRAYARGLYLPSSIDLTEKEFSVIQFAFKQLKKIAYV